MKSIRTSDYHPETCITQRNKLAYFIFETISSVSISKNVYFCIYGYMKRSCEIVVLYAAFSLFSYVLKFRKYLKYRYKARTIPNFVA